MNNNIDNRKEDKKKSKNKIKENDKNENENIINELNKKYLALEDKINKLVIQNDGIMNSIKIINENVFELQKGSYNDSKIIK